MPRLFTGIELPEDVIGRLSILRAGLSGAHWIDPDNYHITMRFVGDISDEEANQFADALAGVSFDSFDIELSGLGSLRRKQTASDLGGRQALAGAGAFAEGT